MVFNSVVKELCFKHLQDIVTTYVHDITMLYSLTTYLIPSETEVQKALETSLSNNGKEKCYLVLNKLKWKRSECQLFYLPALWPAPFLPTVIDATQIIL